MDCAFIDDGYTRKSLVKGAKGLYPDVTFGWRPTNIGQRARYFEGLKKLTDQYQTERYSCECLAKQLVDWDLKDRQGNPRPINGETVFALHPGLFNRLYHIVISMTDAPDEELTDNDWQQASMQAALEGTTLEAYTEKN